MQTLTSVARRPQEAGEPLRPVFFALEQRGIRARRGTATYIAGPPGGYKTGLALAWVLKLNRPTLYFSADSEPFEMVERSAAILSGDSTERVRQSPADYAGVLADLPIRMVFEDSPSYDDVVQELAAYAEVFGHFPEIIVIDNMLNLTGDKDDEWAAHRDHARVIHRITRVTKAAVFVLAHMADDKTDPSGAPQPRSKLQGKVSHLPKLILSLAFDGEQLKTAAVKNRFGPADPSGQEYVSMYVNPSTGRVYNTRAEMVGDVS